jgi:hypothetical protein
MILTPNAPSGLFDNTHMTISITDLSNIVRPEKRQFKENEYIIRLYLWSGQLQVH